MKLPLTAVQCAAMVPLVQTLDSNIDPYHAKQ
jgi:hypothetical protein